MPCPRGQFQANYNSYNCTLCPPGKFWKLILKINDLLALASWNDQIGQAACINCGQGHWGVAVGASAPDVCSDCPEGYYCPLPRTTKPLPCPSDHYCERGSSDPSSCPFLFQSPAISTVCVIVLLLLAVDSSYADLSAKHLFLFNFCRSWRSCFSLCCGGLDYCVTLSIQEEEEVTSTKGEIRSGEFDPGASARPCVQWLVAVFIALG